MRKTASFNFVEKCQYGVLVQCACGKGLRRIIYLKSGVQSVCVGTVKPVKNPMRNEEHVAILCGIYTVSNDELSAGVRYDMDFCIIVIVKG